MSGLIPRELSGGCSDGADDILDVLTAQSVDECFQLCSDNMVAILIYTKIFI